MMIFTRSIAIRLGADDPSATAAWTDHVKCLQEGCAMAKPRRQPPFWRRGKPNTKYDIALLRPADQPRGERFETSQDAREESERSEKLLRSFSGGSKTIAEFLQECRAGYYECNKPFCPICARVFRRWFIGELLRVTEGQKEVHIYTLLLKEAPKDKIYSLDPAPFRHELRKRLQRPGLANVPVIGGFEIVYKAKRQVWVLHINLVMIGGDKSARKAFKKTFQDDDLDRPLVRATLKDKAEQLSYVLKFTTYHRPYEQQGSAKTEAKPLNPKEHAALLKWMSQFEFEYFLLLINARRQGGTKIALSPPAAGKD
jgi:hypothetical protein